MLAGRFSDDGRAAAFARRRADHVDRRLGALHRGGAPDRRAAQARRRQRRRGCGLPQHGLRPRLVRPARARGARGRLGVGQRRAGCGPDRRRARRPTPARALPGALRRRRRAVIGAAGRARAGSLRPGRRQELGDLGVRLPRDLRAPTRRRGPAPRRSHRSRGGGRGLRLAAARRACTAGRRAGAAAALGSGHQAAACRGLRHHAQLVRAPARGRARARGGPRRCARARHGRAARAPGAARRGAVGRGDRRRDARRLRARAPVLQGPDRVRAADRIVPGDQAPARRHEPVARDVEGPRRRRRDRTRRRRARRCAAGSRREGLRRREERGARAQLLPGLRRHRLHLGPRSAPLHAPDGCRRGVLRIGGVASGTAARRSGSGAMSTTPDPAALEQYRARTRRWLEENLERRKDGAGSAHVNFGAEEQTIEAIAAQRALQRRLFEAGYAGITWPKQYGGQGLHAAHERIFQEEARGFVLPDLGLVGGATLNVCAPTMLTHASPEFLKRHIPKILAGEELVAQFFSDPDAGSDLAAVRTQAVRDGARWLLNGSKIWSSGAYYADVGMCLARTDWDVPKHRGLTWFLVPTQARGVTIERIQQINGNSEFCQEYFSDVELCDDDVIGQVNDGWTVAQTMLLYERGAGVYRSNAAPKAASGIARDVLELAASVGALGDRAARELIAQIHVDDLAR